LGWAHKQKGQCATGPFLANDEPKLRQQPVPKLAPGFEKGGDSANYFGFFVFLFFFAMMNPPGLDRLTNRSNLCSTVHVSRILDRRHICNRFYEKSVYFSVC
jgi:hypothetical protein